MGQFMNGVLDYLRIDPIRSVIPSTFIAIVEQPSLALA